MVKIHISGSYKLRATKRWAILHLQKITFKYIVKFSILMNSETIIRKHLPAHWLSMMTMEILRIITDFSSAHQFYVVTRYKP